MGRKIVVGAVSILLALCISACRENPQQSPAPARNGIGAQGASPIAANSQQPQLKVPLTPQYASQTVQSGLGAIAGRVHLINRGGVSGNLFIFIMDPSTLESQQKKALASQVIPADRTATDTVDFTLANVPAGQYFITVTWDTGLPYCKISESVCEVSLDDRASQSDVVNVAAGVVVGNVDITVP